MSARLRFLFAPTSAPDDASKVAPKAATTVVPTPHIDDTLMSSTPLFAEYDVSRGTRKTPKVWRAFFAHDQSEVSATVDDHARLFLRWLQGHQFLVGNVIPAGDLKKLYPNFCRRLALTEIPWQTLAASINRQIGGQRRYRRVHGRNVRVYRIPRNQLK